ncbi:uncharacterized protein BO88DRAFT_427317 [Aspergillus vadensis CBS 113365]|uniref:Uncharacterized protein n=1 Tax=Aspergillus vadensis (strain CBS 113365 / IMI 142717 / IBT 24658) TaxID=1448311 RepID=A0A319BVN1_ASPVC|nr:hypothetical protein BO88DRAFT_427317 [Aspergillus vadensis CBS 113365]PYH67188.1 hypothetical protein BO88DRAFT_427317 [Aspergillus vadensis CBS 113365]
MARKIRKYHRTGGQSYVIDLRAPCLAGQNKNNGWVPCLPTSLPFPAQHRILQVLQQRLERSAFESIQEWHPQLGQANGRDYAEHVELHMAFKALDRKRYTHSTSGLSKIPKKGVNRLRVDIEGIRHAAIHCQLQDYHRLLQQVHSAREFATVWLGDPQSRTHHLQGNLTVRMGCNRIPEDRRYQFLLRKATRRLLEKTNHDCIEQVDYILQLSFPPLYTKK